MRREAIAREPWEGHRIASRRVDRIDGRDPGRPVIGVVDAAVAVKRRLRIYGKHGIRSKRPDLADQLLAQGEIVGERAIGLVEERDAVIADDRRRGPLLDLANGRQL